MTGVTGRPVVDVFRGPSIGRAETDRLLAGQPLTARLHGPAAQGDVLAAVQRGTAAVLLVDGVYEQQPAVWHKEILHALSAGVLVIGSSSMGALRAAECGPFGMIGVGAVHAQLISGVIDRDDELAVSHLDAEHDWRATSVALVDVRATVAAAVDDGLLPAAASAELVARAAATFYPHRSWPALLAGLGKERARRLRDWLADGAVSVKHDDAVAALTALPQLLAAPAATPSWQLQQSRPWRHALAAGSVLTADPVTTDATGEADPVADLADTVRLLKLRGEWPDIWRAGLLRQVVLAIEPPPTEDDSGALAELRAALGLAPGDEAGWGRDVLLDAPGVRRLAHEQRALTAVWQREGAPARARAVDHLRVTGRLIPLLAEARARRAALAELAWHQPPASDEDVWRWWCAITGGTADPQATAAWLEFADTAELWRTVREEHLLATAAGTGAEPSEQAAGRGG